MVNSVKFWDRMAKRYAKMPVSDQKAYERKLEITKGYFTPDSEVLEFGCGTGTTALHHAPNVKHILATDISGNMLEIARDKARDQGIENVTFERHDIADFEAPAETYDTVLAMSILHLIEDKEAAIAKSYEWLKPGGVFVSSTICMGEMAFFWPAVISVMRLVGFAPAIVNPLKHEALETSIRHAGFDIEVDLRFSKEKVAFIVAQKPA